MPNLFSRRRSSSMQPVDRATSSAATAAAGSAFIQRNQSNPNLSSAAAAAALRSNTTSPEPVGSIQTKRMIRRGSQTSVGSGSVVGSASRGGPGRGGLQRTTSNGSMTDRTFRSPSPSAANVTMSPGSPGSDVPPVPALPSHSAPRHKRSASLDPPERVVSPTPARGKRGSSVDRVNMPSQTQSPRTKRLSGVVELDEQERTLSKPTSQQNFSRPMAGSSPGAETSSAARRYTHGSGSWHTQPGGVSSGAEAKAKARPASMGSAAALKSFRPQQPAPAVPTGKATQQNRVSSAGSHLALATQDTTSKQPDRTYEAADSVMVYDPHSRTFVQQPRSTQEPAQPPSPAVPDSPKKGAGAYDPHTRSFIPKAQRHDEQLEDVSVASDDFESSATPAPLAPQSKAMRPVIDTNVQPPPKNPARHSPSESPSSVSFRPGNTLHKQPSVVREDREGEDKAEQGLPVAAPKTSGKKAGASSAPTKSYASYSTPSHNRSASLDVPRGGSGSGGRGRNTSLSPSRSAHFSPSPVLEATRHEPPPRDISPAKSAMKHSPASSVRTSSPMATFSATGPKSPSSETSETQSLASHEGMVKSKKSVRVSFQEDPPEIVPGESTGSPRAGARRGSHDMDEEEDETMRPRPALPSFGSVRQKRMQPGPAEKVTEMPPERHESSSDHAVGGILATHLSSKKEQEEPLAPEVTSKDQAGYVSDESSDAGQAMNAASEQQDPTVVLDKNGNVAQGQKPRSDLGLKEDTSQRGKAENGDVPDITLMPPTPGLDEGRSSDEDSESAKANRKANRSSMEAFSVPGSWATEDGDDEANQAEEPPVKSEVPVKPAAEGRRGSATEESAATQTVTPIHVPREEELDLSDIEEDSDDSAAFSDAAEDPSEFEDGGFASLNAILDSPVASPATKASAGQVAPSSPLAGRSVDTDDENLPNKSLHDPQTSGDWDEATAYWSKLSKHQRDQIELAHDPKPGQPGSTAKQPAKTSKQAAAPSAQPAKSAMKKSMREEPESPQPKSAMKKSMRNQGKANEPAAADDGVHLRKSMRTGAGGGGMTSLRDGPPRRPQSPPNAARDAPDRNRPMSSGSASLAAGGAAMDKGRPRSSAGLRDQVASFPPAKPSMSSSQREEPPQVSARLQKELARGDDSDSESSFRKRRKRGSDDPSKINMRRSMRGGAPAERPMSSSADMRPTSPAPTARGGKGSAFRSLSPSGSLFGRKKGENLRESLRAPPQETGARTTLRGPPKAQEPSKSKFGFRPRSSSAAAPTPKSKPKLKSRFADSDDEDEPSGGFFRSRFADSDGDEPASPSAMRSDLTPVRPIPRRKGQEDGDSTDLSDEDGESIQDPRKASRKRDKQSMPLVPNPADVEKAMAAARRNVGVSPQDTAANEGGALQKGSLRKPQPLDTSAQPTALDSPADTPRRRRGFMGSFLGRNRASTVSIPQVQTQPQSPPSSPPSHGKLVRRSSQQPAPPQAEPAMHADAADDDAAVADWPLASPSTPPNKPFASTLRPSTSDGVNQDSARMARTLRPSMQQRSQSGQAGGGQQRVRILAGDEGSEPGERPGDSSGTYAKSGGKKKRFGALRRAFRLDD